MKIVTIARKPLSDGVARNCLDHQTGALNINACRVAYRPGEGRWPANLVIQHAEGCKAVGTRRVKTGVAVRERGGGKTIFSETKKPALPNMSYADEDGTEEVAHWECVLGCPAAVLDHQGGDASRFFLQLTSKT